MMQEEMEKKRQQLLQDRQQREAEHDQAEMEKVERYTTCAFYSDSSITN